MFGVTTAAAGVALMDIGGWNVFARDDFAF